MTYVLGWVVDIAFTFLVGMFVLLLVGQLGGVGSVELLILAVLLAVLLTLIRMGRSRRG